MKPLKEDGEPTNMTGASFATTSSPLFVTKRWAGMKEYEVPAATYKKMRVGRENGSRWLNYIEDEDLRNQVRDTFHGDGQFLVTCQDSKVSSIIRKVKN